MRAWLDDDSSSWEAPAAPGLMLCLDDHVTGPCSRDSWIRRIVNPTDFEESWWVEVRRCVQTAVRTMMSLVELAVVLLFEARLA